MRRAYHKRRGEKFPTNGRVYVEIHTEFFPDCSTVESPDKTQSSVQMGRGRASRFSSSTQPETRKLQQVCCRLAVTCGHQADIRMRSHRLLRLNDNKSAASCQQAYCKLRSADLLQIANCRLAASCERQTCCICFLHTHSEHILRDLQNL